MSRPLIGVSVSEIRAKASAQAVIHGEPTQTEVTLGLPYMHAVEMAGGLPVALTPLAPGAAEDLLEHVSGVLLSGGPDLHPRSYGADPDPELGPTNRDVDEFELELARSAERRGVPVLGICRGAQVLNVALGGTLVQHLPAHTDRSVEHRQSAPGSEVTHEVRVAPDSRLARATGGGPVDVNSFHHQAVDCLSPCLRPVAWAPDGVVEGIECTDRRFLLGVQWHAETLVAEGDQLALFAQLIEAAAHAGQIGGSLAGSV